MPAENCPFCPPRAEAVTFAESENFRAVYNRAPVLPGHVLVIPKKHIRGFLEIEESLLVEMISFSRKVIKVIAQVFKSDAFDWTIQDGKPAGQTIEHMHIHIIPRHEKDFPEPGDWYPALEKKVPEIIDSLLRPRLNDKEMKTVIDHLKKCFEQQKTN
jgi:bis(5'-adenosyl)-triphosphatase